MKKPTSDTTPPATVEEYIGQRLRHARKSRGLSAREIAEQVGMSHKQLYKFELGKDRISASSLYRLAQFFDVSPNFFFEGMLASMPFAHEPQKKNDVQESDVTFLIQNFLKIDSSDRGNLFKDFITSVTGEEE